MKEFLTRVIVGKNPPIVHVEQGRATAVADDRIHITVCPIFSSNGFYELIEGKLVKVDYPYQLPAYKGVFELYKYAVESFTFDPSQYPADAAEVLHNQLIRRLHPTQYISYQYIKDVLIPGELVRVNYSSTPGPVFFKSQNTRAVIACKTIK